MRSLAYSSDRLQRLSVRKSIAAVLIYLILRTLIFGVWFDEWTFIDGMYFTVVSFTTW